MSREVRLYLDDIIDAIDAITEYTGGLDAEAFKQGDRALVRSCPVRLTVRL